MYKGVLKTLITDDLFIVKSIRVNDQGDAAEFYTTVPKILMHPPFKDERIHNINDDNEGKIWLIS